MRNVMVVFVVGALLSLSIFSWAASGEITFEKFRMLTTGMTEGQVLAKVGSPSSRFVTSCVITSQVVTCPTIWTYLLGDGWTADLTFSVGRLVKIDQTKTP